MKINNEEYLSKDGEPMTTNRCQCCGREFPNHTLNIVGYRSRCDDCVMCNSEGECRGFQPYTLGNPKHRKTSDA